MKETSATTRLALSGSASGSSGCRIEARGVRALHAYHARILTQRLCQLSTAHVESIDTRRAPLQQAVGEAAGRGADVEAHASGGIHPEGIEGTGKLLPSP